MRTVGLSSEAEGLRFGRGAGGGAAPSCAIAAGPAAACLSCKILKTLSEHCCKVSINSFTSSAWSRALGYLMLIRYFEMLSHLCECFSSFSRRSFSRNSVVDEYWALSNFKRLSISRSTRVLWPLTEEYEQRTSSVVISEKSMM